MKISICIYENDHKQLMLIKVKEGEKTLAEVVKKLLNISAKIQVVRDISAKEKEVNK